MHVCRVARAGSIADFTPSQLSSAMWALACMQQADTAPFRRAWAELKARGPGAFIAEGTVALTQIWQTALAVKLEATWAAAAQVSPSVSSSPSPQAAAAAAVAAPALPRTTKKGKKRGGSGGGGGADAAQPLLGLSDESDAGMHRLLSAARSAFLGSTTALRKKVHSSYQRSIANALTRARTMHVLEDNSGGYAVDVSLPGARIAIEADGPTHVARTDEAHMLGATAMKKRHLQVGQQRKGEGSSSKQAC